MDIAEDVHVNVLKSGGLMREEHALIYPGLVPRNPELYWEGVMIDDRVGIRVYKPATGRECFDTYAFSCSGKIYEQAKLERHLGKAKREVGEAIFVGAQLDSASGTLGAPRHKIGALAALHFGIAVRGLTTVVMLEMSTDQLAYVGCFRRPLLAALGHVFRQTSLDGLRETVF